MLGSAQLVTHIGYGNMPLIIIGICYNNMLFIISRAILVCDDRGP